MKENEKKRLLVFCLYNKDGNIENYVIKILSQLRLLMKRIIIVSNNKIAENSLNHLKEFTNEIIIRNNIGLDYGAYREVFLGYLNGEEKKYDEIVLCNDTFYGFFTPIEKIFFEMENKNCDMWGLNKVDRGGILNHIQSYFLVLNKNLVQQNVIRDYLSDNPVVDESYGAICARMEMQLYYYLTKNGYVCDAYTDLKDYDLYANPYTALKKFGLPILKRKSFDSRFCDKKHLKNAIKYLEEQGYKEEDFKIYVDNNEAIDQSIIGERRLRKAQISVDDLLKWADAEPFYIFGYGNIAQELFYTYFESNKNFMGFVVSQNKVLGVRQELQDEIEKFLPSTMKKLLIWN